jgi:phytoene/squalene synthetase
MRPGRSGWPTLAAYRARPRCRLRRPPPQSARWPQVFGPLAAMHRAPRLPGAAAARPARRLRAGRAQPATPTAPALLDYCRRSANPVGGCCCTCTACTTSQALRSSDAICSALQLINFWQDLSVDLPRGRNYVPAPTGRRTDCPTAAQPTRPALRAWCASCATGHATLMRAARRWRCACPGAPAGNCAWWCRAACASSRRSRRMDHAPCAQRPRWAADLPLLLWRALRMRPAAARRSGRMTPEQYVQDKAARSGSSFYYAFLFLPPRAARRDHRLLRLLPRGRRRGRRGHRPRRGRHQAALVAGEVAQAVRRPAHHPVMQALQPHARLRHRADHLLAVIEGCQIDLEQTRFLDFAGLQRYCHLVAGVVGEVAAASSAAAARSHVRTRTAGPGDAADQHHPRRRRGRAPRPHLPADVRAAALRRQGARDPAARQRPGATASASRR